MSEKVPQQAAPQQAAPAQQPFNIDTSQISTIYANFCQVTSLPEELILDFGLNTQMTPTPNQTIRLSHRLVLNYFTAKRLLQGLHMAVSRFEQNFGGLELDVQKRVRPQPAASPPAKPEPPAKGGKQAR